MKIEIKKIAFVSLCFFQSCQPDIAGPGTPQIAGLAGIPEIQYNRFHPSYDQPGKLNAPADYIACDYTIKYNERIYWIETDDRTGEPRICYQPIGVYPQFFKQPYIRCVKAISVPTPAHLPKSIQCWTAHDLNGLIICQKANGAISVLYPTKK